MRWIHTNTQKEDLMYGMHMGAPTSTRPVERTAAAIAMRSRRTARAEERSYWIASHERERAGPKRPLRLVQSTPARERGLVLVKRA
jgi:hypothetical protein